MLGYRIELGTFDGILGEQQTAAVYKGDRFLKEFFFPFAHLRARIWVLLHFWR